MPIKHGRKVHRKYSLFELRSNHWVRLALDSYSLDLARRVWQNDLLAPTLGCTGRYEVLGIRSLRPVQMILPASVVQGS